MIIQRIRVKNYRTYFNLDLDLTVEEGKPLVLIGGANGGGKTTLFNAIAGALYGLKIPDAETFLKEINAGAIASNQGEPSIELELWFKGQLLNQMQQYVLTRTWVLTTDRKVNWGVKLNLEGNILAYGAAQPDKERQQMEMQVNKVIKGNLPKELSQYFLFDAMTSGEKLSEDQLGKVIRENIENVMGLRKYMDLSQAAKSNQQNKLAARIQAKADRENYLTLVTQQRESENRLRDMEMRKDQIDNDIALQKEFIAELKSAKEEENVTQKRLEQIEKSIVEIKNKESHYRFQLDEYVKGIEKSIAWPHMAQSLFAELTEEFANYRQSKHQNELEPEKLKALVERIMVWLETHAVDIQNVDQTQLLQDLSIESTQNVTGAFANLEEPEIRALEDLLRTPQTNLFANIDLLRKDLLQAVQTLPSLQKQMEDLQAKLAGKDYSPLKRYEQLVKEKVELDEQMEALRQKLVDCAHELQHYDLTQLDEPDPRYEALCRLKDFFEEAADALLADKKKRIEQILKEDLNRNLAAYRDVIDRVELSENLRNLSFKIFHKSGNEIYLGQLNAASKQVVVQVLLKALHESGDYDPPVMIDTVMGVLDKESRATVLQNYFPSLSHQTILLSTDSEIDPDRDLSTLIPHISKSWTLVRDREAQSTHVESGYFGKSLEEV